MTTLVIEGYANEEALVIGASDINLKVRLRRKVVPKFEMDVGECAWRRKNATLAVSANDREYDLPTDFGKMLETPVLVTAAGVKTGLQYLGEDTMAMALAEQDTTVGGPSRFWFTRVTGPPTVLRAIKFDKIPDQAFTLYYSYLSEIVFTDDTTSVELDNYIPLKFQWALVEGLKAEIFAARLSIDDPRLTICQQNYGAYVDATIDYREPGMRRPNKRIKTGPL